MQQDQGIIAPFQLICFGCSAQGVRSPVDNAGRCPRCGQKPVPFLTSDPLPVGVKPVGIWCHAGISGQAYPHFGSRPSWLERSVRRMLFGDVWLDAAP